MGDYQSHALDPSVFPADGDGGTGRALAPFAFDHQGSMRCCLETLYAANDLGMTRGDAAIHCGNCARIWHKADGWWSIEARGAPIRQRRGQEAGRERIRRSLKRNGWNA